MMPFKKCPICGAEVEEKEVEKLLRGGERLYNEETIRRFEDIRRKLERQQTAEFQLMGHSFKVE